MVSSFFLIYLCLMQAISFAVQYSSATFGFLLNVGSFLSVLDTYQKMAKNLAREVLHATFFMRGEPRATEAEGIIMISDLIKSPGRRAESTTLARFRLCNT